MRKSPMGILLLLAMTVVLTACSQKAVELSPELETLLARINEVRSQGYKCASGEMPPAGPLYDDGRINWAAQMHAEDMDAARVLSHDTPPGAIHFAPGTPPGERLLQAGYLYAAMGEDIARGQISVEEVLADWLASTEGHCEALMGATYRDAGLGHSGVYWVLDLAAPK